MLRLLLSAIIFNVAFSSSSRAIKFNQNYTLEEARNWAEITATRLVTCYYDELTGLWSHESPWQSGNTLESLANFLSLVDSPLKFIFRHTFSRTDIFTGGDCYDDHQWWLLAWLQAYNVDQDVRYLHRAALIYEIVAATAWRTKTCQGGIQWCPTKAYKNAITNELFLLSSMRLHPYAKLLGKSPTYYLNWALKEWQWFENSGMINRDYLINDGLNSPQKLRWKKAKYLFLNDDTCMNNNQTTWTYNQGVILSGLALLSNATRNSTLIDIAQYIADATIDQLTYSNGILKEPCEPYCDNDQKLFKGIFVRHLSYLLPYVTETKHIQKYKSFLQKNAISLLTTNRCELDGLFDLFWNNNAQSGCSAPRNTATTSSAFDLLISVAEIKQPVISSNWVLIGLGNCMDDQNLSMSNFYKENVNETVCRSTANADNGSIAYDYQLKYNGDSFCRIRTLSDRHKTPSGWAYENGSTSYVSRTNKIPLTNCYLKLHAV